MNPVFTQNAYVFVIIGYENLQLAFQAGRFVAGCSVYHQVDSNSYYVVEHTFHECRHCNQLNKQGV